MDIGNKKTISPEQLIGIVCGSVGAFFIILAIIIFAYRKKREVNKFIDEPSFSTDETDDDDEGKIFTVAMTENTLNAGDDNWV